MSSYPTPAFRRPALAPAILAAIVLLAGIALIGTDGFIWIRYAACILAIIVGVFTWQAKQWWWLIPLAPVAVLFNPVFPIELGDQLTLGLNYIAVIVFIAVGVLVKVKNPEDRNKR